MLSPHSCVIAVWPQLFCTSVWVLLQGTVDSSQTAPQNTSCCLMFRFTRNLLHMGRPVYRHHVFQRPEHNLWSPSNAGEFQPTACALVFVRVHVFGARLQAQLGEGWGGKWHPKYFVYLRHFFPATVLKRRKYKKLGWVTKCGVLMLKAGPNQSSSSF